MNATVQQLLKTNYVLVTPGAASASIYKAARHPLVQNALAVAICKLDCCKMRTGSFLIFSNTTPNDPVIKKALRHAKSCATAQSLKEQRRHMGIVNKPRYMRKLSVDARCPFF